MAPLRAIEKVFLLTFLGFGGGGIGVWVGDFGGFTVGGGVGHVPVSHEGGEVRGEEDVALGDVSSGGL